jgi:hypothetical protein
MLNLDLLGRSCMLEQTEGNVSMRIAYNIYQLVFKKCFYCGKQVVEDDLIREVTDTVANIDCEISFKCPHCLEEFDSWSYGSYHRTADLQELVHKYPRTYALILEYKNLIDKIGFNKICRKAWVLSKGHKWQYYKVILWITCFRKFFKLEIPLFVKPSNLTDKQRKALQAFSSILKSINKE